MQLEQQSICNLQQNLIHLKASKKENSLKNKVLILNKTKTTESSVLRSTSSCKFKRDNISSSNTSSTGSVLDISYFDISRPIRFTKSAFRDGKRGIRNDFNEQNNKSINEYRR